MQIEKKRSRRVGHVGDVDAASKMKNKPAIDGAEKQLAALQSLLDGRYVFEQPFELKIWQ